jgi:hypothetical protein
MSRADTVDVAVVALDELQRILLRLRFGRQRLRVWKERSSTHRRSLTLGRPKVGSGSRAITIMPLCCIALAITPESADTFVGIGAPEERDHWAGGWFARFVHQLRVPLDDPKFFDKIEGFVKATVGRIAP